MKLDIYQIDAFSSRPFEGNPAAVIPLDMWLPDHMMQAIAEENNLSETVFFVLEGSAYRIRWFTPNAEVKLCGHATLAAAWVLFERLGYAKQEVVFESLSGPLTVRRSSNRLMMNFPVQTLASCEAPELLVEALGVAPIRCLKGDDYLAVFESQSDIERISPNFHLLKSLDLRGVIVTAPGKEKDFVLRFFAPQIGIDEDPVTGSAFTQAIPYWAEQVKQSRFNARQLSSRGGDVFCELLGDRMVIAGEAVEYLKGSIDVPV